MTTRRFLELPDIGAGISDAEVVTWHKSPGESFASGETILQVETDKAVINLPAPESGVLVEVLSRAGETVPVGGRLAEYMPSTASAPRELRRSRGRPRATASPEFDAVWSAQSPTYASVLQKVQTRVETLVREEALLRGFRVARIEGRVKSKLSVFRKVHRMRVHPERASARLDDIVGVRVVCNNTSDCYALLDAIRVRFSDAILRVKDYIRTPLPTGYRAIHVILRAPQEAQRLPGALARCEIQIRTLAQDLWAALSHADVYKDEDLLSDALLRQVRNLGDMLYEVDRLATDARHSINSFVVQHYYPYDPEDTLTIESLDSYLSSHGVKMRPFWLALHLANLREHGLGRLSEVESLIHDPQLVQSLRRCAEATFGQHVRLGIGERMFFGAVLRFSGIPATEAAMARYREYLRERGRRS